MDLTPYVENLRGELLAAADSGEARALAERLTAVVASASRLTILEVLSAAAEEVTRDLAPGSVEIRLRGRNPYFVVTPPGSSASSGGQWAPDDQRVSGGRGADPGLADGPGTQNARGASGPPAGWDEPDAEDWRAAPDWRDTSGTWVRSAPQGRGGGPGGAGASSAGLPPMPTEFADGRDGAVSRINFRPPEQLKLRIEAAAAQEGLSVNAWLVRVTSAAVTSGIPADSGRPDSGRRRPRRDSGGGGRFVGWVG
ncbi:Toxin-antitoxin system HicB family antitoxin [Frankia sp. AiPs1]|uniref:hypothetical protein n=1 Tax=Frankia sp. AiPa1 TaxID=573492 RepID=UPI00202B9651|nr:hypothetical protein [Frankia sp. AiPa1]MCL9757931.1 hypothetical protein [Frankia sp. AiPa1]